MRQATNLKQLFLTMRQAVSLGDEAQRAFARWAAIPLIAASSIPLGAQAFLGRQAAHVPAKKPDLTLRSIAVVEWTGSKANPTSTWLIPIAVYTNGEYMDGNGYLADPAPLAVQKGTQYVLEKSGVPQSMYDLASPQRIGAAWVGRGMMEALPSLAPPEAAIAEGSSGRPHYFRNHSGMIQPLPTLHLRPPDNRAPLDEDRPEMTGDAAAKASASRLTSFTQSVAHRSGQMVAISDAGQSPTRPLQYRWKSAIAEADMRAKIQILAEKFLRRALQPNGSPKKVPAIPAVPTLSGEDFRCFALTAEKKASEEVPTCFFSGEHLEKFGITRYVAVIARPNIYGQPQVLAHSSADSTQLDTHPRVHLVDAVNATGSGNAQLLIEFDGATHRRFALYGLKSGQIEAEYVSAELPF